MDKKLELIYEIMEELKNAMEDSPDEIGGRLGRQPEGVEIMKIETDSPELQKEEELLGEDLDGDMEMGESPEHAAMVLGEESPDEKIKQRLMKLRG